jgi:glycosyltransferase involved in cell wall biosynthesis
MKNRPAFITTVHGLNSVSAYSAIMLKGDAVIAVSETTRTHLLQRYPQANTKHIDVISRGIDPLFYRPNWQPEDDWTAEFYHRHPQLKNRPWLLLPGRGTRLKGHTDALNLVAELRARGIDIGVLLLGVISEERDRYVRELEHWAQHLQIEDRVVFASAAVDVRPYYAKSLAVLQLSNRPETFGRVVAEALSMNRPVLGYDHGGVGELLTRHFDFGRVPIGRIDDLADRVEALLNGVNPPLSNQLPNLADMQNQTLAVYARITNKLGNSVTQAVQELSRARS